MRKSILFIAAVVVLTSCVQKYNLNPDPEVESGGQYMFSVSLDNPFLGGDYLWNVSKDVVGVYAENQSNCRYVLRGSSDGKSGEAAIYGPQVKGDVYAYFPYKEEGVAGLEEGRVLVPSEQKYSTDAAELIQTYSTLAGLCSDGKVTLRYNLGVLKVNLKVDFDSNVNVVVLTCKEDISGKLDISGRAEERLTEASKTITVTGIDKPCSEIAPLEVRFLLPEGEYTEIYVNASSVNESVMANVKSSQPVSVAACRETVANAEVSVEDHNYGGSDFDEETVHFD